MIGLGVGRIRRAFAPFLGEDIVQAVVGFFQEFDVGHPAYKAVGVGEEAPFREDAGVAEFFHDFAVGQARQGLYDFFMLGQGRAHLAEIPAFHQREAVLHDFAALPQADQALRRHAGGQAVFAAVQGIGYLIAGLSPLIAGINVDLVVKWRTFSRGLSLCGNWSNPAAG